MKNILISLLLAAHSAAFSQIEPKVKFTLHLEDAIGNVDSVVIGFDTLAHPYIDPAFGEVLLNDVPFDSVFESRGSDISGYQFTSKTVVHYYQNSMCAPTYIFPQVQAVIIHAKQFPIKISWDSTYFKDDCYDWTFFTRSWAYLFNPNWGVPDIQLLEQSEWIVEENFLKTTNGFMNNYVHPVEGGGNDKIYVIWVGLAANKPSVATEGIEKLGISLFPNPAQDHLQCTLPDDIEQPESLQLFDENGKIVRIFARAELAEKGFSISLMGLSKGIFFGQLSWQNPPKTAAFKFEKL